MWNAEQASGATRRSAEEIMQALGKKRLNLELRQRSSYLDPTEGNLALSVHLPTRRPTLSPCATKPCLTLLQILPEVPRRPKSPYSRETDPSRLPPACPPLFFLYHYYLLRFASLTANAAVGRA